MMPRTIARRCLLAQALSWVVLVSASHVSFGLSEGEESKDKMGAGKSGGKTKDAAGKENDQEKGDKGTAKKGKSAVLTVVVTGKGKAIPQAEVKVKVPGGEERRPTNQEGEASFSVPGAGKAEVRIIVAGWESALKEVVLKEGPQRLTIELKALPDAK